MDTSPTSFLSEIREGPKGREIPKHKLAYFRARLRNRIYDLVVSEFARQQEMTGATKADLARRIGRDPAQLTRWLSSPSNWTLDTISDLMTAMGTEPQFAVESVGHAQVAISAAPSQPMQSNAPLAYQELLMNPRQTLGSGFRPPFMDEAELSRFLRELTKSRGLGLGVESEAP
jgi:transposase-like protein